MKIAFYSTDWTREPVQDKIKSALTGRDEFIPGKKLMTFGGTFFYRMAMPAMELNNHGYDNFLSYQIDTAPDGHLVAMDTTGEWHDDCDAIVFQRWMGENGPDITKRAIASGQTVIQDVDDDFWALTKSNIAYDTTDPIKNPAFNRTHYWDMIAASSAITVSTDALRKRFERLGVPTYVLRNAIDIERWPIHDPSHDGMIGWIGGIQWRAHDMHIMKPFLPDFLEDFGLPFYHGGDSQVPGVQKAWEQIGIDPQRVQCTGAPLCHISEYPKLWEPVNIALVPLEVCAFNAAKSYLKSLEASACGIPYIVSDKLPEQRILIDEGSAGRLARNDKPVTWNDHLEDLLDPEVRREEGRRNRAVAELHDIRVRWSDWDKAYRAIIPLTSA